MEMSGKLALQWNDYVVCNSFLSSHIDLLVSESLNAFMLSVIVSYNENCNFVIHVRLVRRT
jgi:hypothetical protein